jgi:hypothetical protein
LARRRGVRGLTARKFQMLRLGVRSFA